MRTAANIKGVTEPVSCEIVGGVGTITFHSPPVNALSRELISGLRAALGRCNEALVVVIASAVPRFFVAGADLTLLATLDPDGFRDYLSELRDVLDQIDQAGFVSIAALDGTALGGGLELALACTLRVASADAALGVPEVKLGLLPGAGGTQRLTRLIGRGRALDLLLTGRSVSGSEAYAAGLVERVTSPVEHESSRPASVAAAAWASQLAAVPPSTAAAIVRCADAACGDFGAGMQTEFDEVLELFGSPVGREGVAAFVEKRRPRFPVAGS